MNKTNRVMNVEQTKDLVFESIDSMSNAITAEAKTEFKIQLINLVLDLKYKSWEDGLHQGMQMVKETYGIK